MTINLRYDNPNDGPYQWCFRKDIVAFIIKRINPDIFGTQEGWEDQIKELAIATGYDYHVFAPEWNRKRMFPCVWTKKEMDILESGTFWLSPTPHIPFSKAWNSAYPRAATYVIAKKYRKFFLFISTHLDNVSKKARLYQAAVLCEEIKKINQENYPIILVGDFNDSPNSSVHALLTGKIDLNGVKGDFIDVWQWLKKDENATFHAFTGKGQRGRIDWILVSSNVKIKNVFLIKDIFAGIYPSDHYPIVAELSC
ncbi:MAG TPA: endonuclease/exonuclease/phosphatase family protein [Candidatus Desulfofervidus auxilii]|uniref:Endonuclease/exonuclease/phosphatase family protein n=1 Tax=Desulfofervidus auxilii TaxID=1621989 RepID=A0A7V0NEX3_DESA2|nr:endonuclease/exonuclease/phosphatase family protein [Candidatus Desulfofervidus auxilii]